MSGQILNSFIIFIRPGVCKILDSFIIFIRRGFCKILNSFIRRGVFYQVLKSFSIYIKTWRSAKLHSFLIFIRPGVSATNYHLLKSFCNEKESGFRFNSFANNNLINIMRYLQSSKILRIFLVHVSESPLCWVNICEWTDVSPICPVCWVNVPEWTNVSPTKCFVTMPSLLGKFVWMDWCR